MLQQNWAELSIVDVGWIVFAFLFFLFIVTLLFYCLSWTRLSGLSCRFLGTCTDVAVEDLHIHGKLQLVLLFNHNIPFPHLAAVTFFFIEE